ncbi:MAG: 2-oxoacid:acceptor oxidoreductase family protein [Deinococcales bacterium]
MSYVGVLAQLLDIQLEAIEEALNHQFKGKAKSWLSPNMNVVKAAYNYSPANFQNRSLSS